MINFIKKEKWYSYSSKDLAMYQCPALVAITN